MRRNISLHWIPCPYSKLGSILSNNLQILKLNQAPKMILRWIWKEVDIKNIMYEYWKISNLYQNHMQNLHRNSLNFICFFFLFSLVIWDAAKCLGLNCRRSDNFVCGIEEKLLINLVLLNRNFFMVRVWHFNSFDLLLAIKDFRLKKILVIFFCNSLTIFFFPFPPGVVLWTLFYENYYSMNIIIILWTYCLTGMQGS